MASEGTASSGLAARYAKALFDLADENKALDQVAQDLTGIRRMLADSVELQRLVRSPVLSRAEQGQAMEAVLDKAGVSDIVRRFVGLVAQNRRLFALGAMIDAFLAELSRRRGEISADVTSAHPLSDRQSRELTDALRASLGARVAVDFSVDPGLLGGMIVRVGSRMIDSSVRTKLQKLQSAMKGPVGGQV